MNEAGHVRQLDIDPSSRGYAVVEHGVVELVQARPLVPHLAKFDKGDAAARVVVVLVLEAAHRDGRQGRKVRRDGRRRRAEGQVTNKDNMSVGLGGRVGVEVDGALLAVRGSSIAIGLLRGLVLLLVLLLFLLLLLLLLLILVGTVHSLGLGLGLRLGGDRNFSFLLGTIVLFGEVLQVLALLLLLFPALLLVLLFVLLILLILLILLALLHRGGVVVLVSVALPLLRWDFSHCINRALVDLGGLSCALALHFGLLLKMWGG